MLVSFAGQIAEPKIIFGGIIVISMAMQGDEPVASGVVLYCYDVEGAAGLHEEGAKQVWEITFQSLVKLLHLSALRIGMSNFPSAIVNSSAGAETDFTFPENVPETRVEEMSLMVTVKASFPYTT